jgi:hypothetical protein
LIVQVYPGLVPSYKIFLLFRAEPLHHIEDILRKFDPILLLHIGQAMAYPSWGEETRPEIVQNRENWRPWRLKGLTDLVGGRMRLLLTESENSIIKIVARGPP